ncbi:MAG: hypothetical protein ABW125_02460, partial [Candidatus Thiodiazotropha lotti]
KNNQHVETIIIHFIERSGLPYYGPNKFVLLGSHHCTLTCYSIESGAATEPSDNGDILSFNT